jgi:hypothetical protein
MVKTYKKLYKVEAIVSKKSIKGQTHYLIKWKNYPSSQNTWEPIKHLENVKWMVDEFNKRGVAPKPVIKSQLIDSSKDKILRPKRGKKRAVKKPKVSPQKPTAKSAAVKQSRSRISSPKKEAQPKYVEIIHDMLTLPTMTRGRVQTIKPRKRVSKSEEAFVISKRKTPRKL